MFLIYRSPPGLCTALNKHCGHLSLSSSLTSWLSVPLWSPPVPNRVLPPVSGIRITKSQPSDSRGKNTKPPAHCQIWLHTRASSPAPGRARRSQRQERTAPADTISFLCTPPWGLRSRTVQPLQPYCGTQQCSGWHLMHHPWAAFPSSPRSREGTGAAVHQTASAETSLLAANSSYQQDRLGATPHSQCSRPPPTSSAGPQPEPQCTMAAPGADILASGNGRQGRAAPAPPHLLFRFLRDGLHWPRPESKQHFSAFPGAKCIRHCSGTNRGEQANCSDDSDVWCPVKLRIQRSTAIL